MNFEHLKKKYDLNAIEEEKKNLEEKMMSRESGENINKLAIELSRKNKMHEIISKLHSKIDAHQQTMEILDSEEEEELTEIAQAEREKLETEIQALEEEIKKEIYSDLLEDPDDEKSIILEIRAGAGGDEASLFASDLFRMYSQYASSMNWNIEIINSASSEGGGSKEVVARIAGKSVFKKLKYESGVHRVQRIPATESSGRIHTSTVSVAVLPEAKDIDVQINPEDIRIDVMRSSGAGGQSVNKIDSAVRITHMPTGIVVSCQETKYQQQNKEKAMTILRSKLYEREKALEQEKRDSLRLSQIGSAMRAEKIRTYNYPQNRVTDHRIKESWHNLDEILNGNLEEVLETVNTRIINMQIEELEKDGSSTDSRNR
jgi:peptide chain release factor 1